MKKGFVGIAVILFTIMLLIISIIEMKQRHKEREMLLDKGYYYDSHGEIKKLEEGKRIPYPEDMWKGLIAEATSEGYQGMKIAALVYRNRIEQGLPLGCVGLKREDLDEFVAREGKQKEVLAKKVIEEVFEEYCKDITNGTTHYENLEDFPEPWWAKEMIIIGKEGKHTLYKER